MRAELLLVAGMIVGAAWAVAELTRVPESGPQSGVAAWVDDHAILFDDYRRALDAVARDRKEGALTPADKERVLNRLIDEQLLVEHGVELGLMRRDPQMRNLLATQVMQSLAEAGRVDAPSEAALRTFYTEEAFRFQVPARYAIAHAFFGGDDATARAVQARGEKILGGDEYPLPLPSGLLLLREIQQILGVTVAHAVAALEVGETSEPVAADDGVHLVRLLDRRGGETRPFETVRDQVLDAYRRAEADRAVRAFLDEERRRRNVRIVVDVAP